MLYYKDLNDLLERCPNAYKYYCIGDKNKPPAMRVVPK